MRYVQDPRLKFFIYCPDRMEFIKNRKKLSKFVGFRYPLLKPIDIEILSGIIRKALKSAQAS